MPWSGVPSTRIRFCLKTNIFFLLFQKNPRPHVAILNRVQQNGIFKSLHSGERFLKDGFSVTVSNEYVWTVDQTGEKYLRFLGYSVNMSIRSFRPKVDSPDSSSPRLSRFAR